MVNALLIAQQICLRYSLLLPIIQLRLLITATVCMSVWRNKMRITI